MILLLPVLFIMFLMVIRVKPPEEENNFYFKSLVLYLLSWFSVDIGWFSFPAGLAYGYYRVNNQSITNIELKKLALAFGLIYFILIRFLPWIPLDEVLIYRENINHINRFSNVISVHIYKPETGEQTKLREHLTGFGDNHIGACINIFRYWVLKKEGITIKDSEWLETVAMQDHGFQDSYHNIDDNTIEAYMSFNDGKQYFALFKRDQSNNSYLSMIVQHTGVKSGQERKFPF